MVFRWCLTPYVGRNEGKTMGMTVAHKVEDVLKVRAFSVGVLSTNVDKVRGHTLSSSLLHSIISLSNIQRKSASIAL